MDGGKSAKRAEATKPVEIWAFRVGAKLHAARDNEKVPGGYRFVAAEIAHPLAADVERAVAEVRERTPDDRVSLVVFSGDLDRVLAAFVIATGAAAAGLEPSMFFTFWGLSVIKSKTAKAVHRSRACLGPWGGRLPSRVRHGSACGQ